jgi:4-oxalocrotonate tautomerase family enzyme
MPFIEANIQKGLSSAKKQELALAITQAVHESIGAPMQYIHVAVTETPSNEFVESGRVDLPYASVD